MERESISQVEKMKKLKIKPVLSAPDVKKHLKELYQKIVIFTIVKALNNFTFM